MAYNAPQNQKNTAKSRINTDGIQLYGDTSTIQFDWWNQTISIKMAPAKDPSDQSPGVYDYKQKLITAMPPDTAVILGNLIESDIIPAIQAGEAKQVGVQTSKLNMFYVSTGVAETGKVEPYMALFMDIDESRKPKRTMTFKFRNRHVFSKFDPNTGEFEMRDGIAEEFKFIAQFFKSAINVMGATAHGVDVGHADDIESDYQFKQAIGSKFGVSYGAGNSYNYASRSAQRDPWGDGNNAPTASAAEAAPAPTLTSMDDLAGLMTRSVIAKGLKAHLLYDEPVKRKKVRLATIKG